MGKPRARSEETKRKLVTAARDLIVEQGWSSLSNRSIADRAGVNLALISYHFGGKKKLLSAMLDLAAAEISELHTPPVASDDLSSFIGAAIEVVPQLLEDANVRVLAVAMLEATYDEELATAVRRNLTALRAQLESVALASGVPEGQASGIATTLAALLDGILIHTLLDPQTDIRGAAEAAKRLSFR